jgi:hypothetical protein
VSSPDVETLCYATTDDTMGGMAKSLKPKSMPVPIRLLESDLPDWDKAAVEERETRSGLLATIANNWLKKRRAAWAARGKGKDKG